MKIAGKILSTSFAGVAGESAQEEKHAHAHECGDECCHHHGDGDGEERSIPQLIAAAVIFGAALVMEHTGFLADNFLAIDSSVSLGKILSVVLYVASYLICGYNVVISAIKNIARGDFFDEEFLMTVASLGAIAVGEYPEAVAVMLLYNIGEYLEDKAVDKSRSSVTALLEIRPDKANVKRGGKITEVSPDEVAVGETVVVKPGERIPNDGIVTAGKSFIDTSALSGESVSVEAAAGTRVLAGGVNTQAAIEIEVTRLAKDSAASKIIRLAQAAAKKKARAEKFITRFSRVYTPAVCVVAVAVAAVPPLALHGSWQTWIYRALTFLVVSCPCAFVISVPLTFFSGIGAASRKGILVKSSEALESLSRAEIAVFDKTGTLTKGMFKVAAIHPVEGRLGAEELLMTAAHAEHFSNHPISRSLNEAHKCEECESAKVMDAEEISGKGIRVTLEGKTVLAGTLALMRENGVTGIVQCVEEDTGTIVHVAVDGLYQGHIVISDMMKEDVAGAMRELKSLGIKKLVMLTGDNEDAARAVAQKAGIDTVFANLLPGGKVGKVEELLAELGGKQKRGTLFFVGDGINDAPVLSRADVGVAMGALGSDAAIESADIVIMTDEQSKMADALRLSKETMAIVRQNVAFAFGVKLLIMILSAAGIANMWLAVFGDTGVALLAILNAVRLILRKKRFTLFDERSTLQV